MSREDDIIWGEDQQYKEPGTAGKIGANALLITAFAGAMTGLGYLLDLGNEKEDQRLLARLTPEQTEIIQQAAQFESCEVITPKMQCLCIKEERAIQAGEPSIFAID